MYKALETFFFIWYGQAAKATVGNWRSNDETQTFERT